MVKTDNNFSLSPPFFIPWHYYLKSSVYPYTPFFMLT